MIFPTSGTATITVDQGQDFEQQDKFNKLRSLPKSMERRGNNGNMRSLSMNHRGNTCNSLNATATIGMNGKVNTFRDKLSKFKDTSFCKSKRLSKGSKLDSFSDHMSSSSFHRSSGMKKQSVTFVKSTKNVVHEIEYLADILKNEIWWTAEELSTSRAEGQILTLTDSSVQKYISLYDDAKRQVKTDRKLPSACLKELVKYVAKGYLGLEDQYNTNARIEEIRDHVLSVVRFYRDQSLENSHLMFHDSFSSTTSSNTMGCNPSNACILDQNVRSYASKMSAGNRHLAIAMGNAVYLASLRDSRNMENSMPNGERRIHRQSSI